MLSLWAIVITVESLNSVFIIFWIKWSVYSSTEAVASSIKITFGLLIRALAIHISYLCPRLIFEPPSSTKKFSNLSISSIVSSFYSTRGCVSLLILLLWSSYGGWEIGVSFLNPLVF